MKGALFLLGLGLVKGAINVSSSMQLQQQQQQKDVAVVLLVVM